jgi:hypothetical protein
VQGAPCSTTLQRTFLALQHWQAFEARLLTVLPPGLLNPAAVALRFADSPGVDMPEGRLEVIVNSKDTSQRYRTMTISEHKDGGIAKLECGGG